MVLQNFDASDQIRNQRAFISDEVPYNLIHRICEMPGSLCLKSSDDTMMFVQTKGHNAWLWVSSEVEADERVSLVEELIKVIKGISLPGISGEPEIAALFARLYGNAKGLESHMSMLMEAYYYQPAAKPLHAHAEGTIHKATSQEAERVAAFIAGFSEDAYGTPTTDPASKIQAAKDMIGAGHLYLWKVAGETVSMANIPHRSERHARINAVFTPRAHRKKGYASGLVAGLCAMLESESFIPMLYADRINPDSNKVYKKIGFVESGQIAEIKFK